MRGISATWLLLSIVCLASCTSGTLAGASSSADEPHCGNVAYGTVKVGASELAPPPSTLSVPDGNFGSNGILIVDHALGEPPEIARVRRGVTSHYVGGFINDGIQNWSAIDLDREIGITVHRHVFNKRVYPQKPSGDPVFPDFALKSTPRPIYGRKWDSDERTEEEVITINRLTPAAKEAFVCVANSAWKESLKVSPFPIITDTLLFDDFLLDFDVSSQKELQKKIPTGGTLDWVFTHAIEGLNYTWPMHLSRNNNGN